MSYIGKTPEFTQFPSKFFNGDGSAMTVSLDYAPPNQAALLVFISGVRQDTSAYTLSGTSLTFTGSVPSGTNNVQVVHLGLTVEVPTPADDTITTAKIQDDAVTAAKIEDDAVTTDKILDDAVTADKLANSINTEIAANTAKVTNATHTGDVTGATALTIAVDAVDIAMLSATGTASSSTFLRGDNAWATAGGDNTPAFCAYMSAQQTIPQTTWTKLELDTEIFDTDGAYDKDTNYRFTVPAGEGGKYVIGLVGMQSAYSGGLTDAWMSLYLNGASANDLWRGQLSAPASSVYGLPMGIFPVIADLSAADYIEAYAYMESTSTKYVNRAVFSAFKLVGV